MPTSSLRHSRTKHSNCSSFGSTTSTPAPTAGRKSKARNPAPKRRRGPTTPARTPSPSTALSPHPSASASSTGLLEPFPAHSNAPSPEADSAEKSRSPPPVHPLAAYATPAYRYIPPDSPSPPPPVARRTRPHFQPTPLNPQPFFDIPTCNATPPSPTHYTTPQQPVGSPAAQRTRPWRVLTPPSAEQWPASSGQDRKSVV